MTSLLEPQERGRDLKVTLDPGQGIVSCVYLEDYMEELSLKWAPLVPSRRREASEGKAWGLVV